MENQGYFSQTFNNNCNTEPKYEMTEQMLHVRAVDCMNFALLDGSPSTLSLNTPIEFDVQFSNGNLNRTNTLSLTNIYDENGNFLKFDTNDTLAGARNNAQNVIGIPPYEQVSKVELKGVSFPFVRNNNHPNLPVELNTKEDYRDNGGDAFFAIDIPEFGGRVHSTTNKLHDVFAIMYYDSTMPETGTIKPIRGVDFDSKTYTPKAPIKRLNKFKIRFLNSTGEVVKLGDFHNAYVDYNGVNASSEDAATATAVAVAAAAVAVAAAAAVNTAAAAVNTADADADALTIALANKKTADDNLVRANFELANLSTEDVLKSCIKTLYQVSLLFEFTIKL